MRRVGPAQAGQQTAIPALADAAGTAVPTGAVPATGEDGAGDEVKLYSTEDADTTMTSFSASVAGSVTLASTGGSQPMNNMQPWLALNYIIALQGTFPSRS